MILSICDEPTVMNIMRYVVLMINILKTVIPIALIISVMIRFVSAVTKHDEASVTKAVKSVVPNLVAAVLIFLVPTFVDIVVKISFPDSDYTKCVSGITIEKVNNAYNTKMDKLISDAESSLEYSDYSSALAYLSNIKDNDKKQEYATKLDTIKKLIQEKKESEKPVSSISILSKDFGTCTWKYHQAYSAELKSYYASPLAFSECVPSGATSSGESLPIIIWLHGSGGESYSAFVGGGLIKVTEEWSTTGLNNIPAIMMAPQLDANTGWSDYKSFQTIKALIKYAQSSYNANTSKVVLMGHSYGGSGVYSVASSNQSLFSDLVIMSGYVRSPGSNADYFKKMPLKGYTEVLGNVDPNTGEKRKTGEIMQEFFKAAGHLDDLTIYEDATHAEVPKRALTTDANNDKISDLIYWLFKDIKISGSSGDSGDSGDSGSSGDDVTPGKFIIDPGSTSGCSKNGKYQWCAPSRGAFGSFPYYDSKPDTKEDRWSLEMDPKWAKANFVTITKTCSNGWTITFQMHRLAKTTWEKVQDKLCQITTTGIDGYKYEPSEFHFSGAKASTVARFVSGTKSISNHAYGTAIDINPGQSYTVNGKSYKPYDRDVKAYENFVKALGREDDKRNINYILWKKIFQPLGFTWGGNWGRNGNKSTFDGMHFEIDWRQTK